MKAAPPKKAIEILEALKATKGRKSQALMKSGTEQASGRLKNLRTQVVKKSKRWSVAK